jgi:hypothetical protein
MRITQKYSHLNGEEYLIVHHFDLYKEIKTVIAKINADDLKNKISKEKTKTGSNLYSPKELNREFHKHFSEHNWEETRYRLLYHLESGVDGTELITIDERTEKVPDQEWRKSPNI